MRKYLWQLALTLIMLFAPTLVAAAPSAEQNQLFQTANQAYQAGAYQEAINSYQQLLKGNYESGNLYYNLGNSYYKSGQFGMAILYYEKARQLLPYDADLQANLKYATQKLNLKQNRDWLTVIGELVPLETLLLILLGISSLLAVLVIGKLFGLANHPKWRSGLQNTLITTIIGWICLVVLIGTTWQQQLRPQAIAIKAGEVYFEPNTASTLYFKVSAGAKVTVINQQTDWLMLKRADGKHGWAKKESFQEI